MREREARGFSFDQLREPIARACQITRESIRQPDVVRDYPGQPLAARAPGKLYAAPPPCDGLIEFARRNVRQKLAIAYRLLQLRLKLQVICRSIIERFGRKAKGSDVFAPTDEASSQPVKRRRLAY